VNDDANDSPSSSRVRAVITDWAGTIVDFVIDSFAELEGVIEEIDRRLALGHRP
jgi:hypothetical protein